MKIWNMLKRRGDESPQTEGSGGYFRIAAPVLIALIVYVVCTGFSCSVAIAVDASSAVLEQLRQDFVMRYLEPEPHIKLARWYYEHGNRLQAFYILEDARRGHFTKEVFARTFEHVFLGRLPFDNSPGAETALINKYGDVPNSADGASKLADIYISRGDWPQAERYLRACVKLEPDNFTYVAGLAEVLKSARMPERAQGLLDRFAEEHPGSKEAFTIKIDRVMRGNPTLREHDASRIKSARPLVEEAAQAYPEAGEFAFDLAIILEREQNWKATEESIVRAASLSNKSAEIQGWTGRFFLKVRKDNAKALGYYLNAYFLDPDFYDTEYAESRILKLNAELAEKKLADLSAQGKAPEEFIRDDNPAVALIAVGLMAENWKPQYVRPLVETMLHDDDAVRWAATTAIMEHAGRSFDTDLGALLKDRDLRRRGLAGYMAVNLWGAKGIEAVRPWLQDHAQLARYDALSALLQYGGDAGRSIAVNDERDESEVAVKSWLHEVLNTR